MCKQAIHTSMRLALVVLPLLVTGCASLGKDDCVKGDWEAIGRQDALDGKLITRIDDHAKACSDYGVKPNATAYGRGFGVGLASYCTARNGYSIGYNRYPYEYNHQCAASTESAFLAGRQLGIDIHDLNSRISDLFARIDNLGDKVNTKGLSDNEKADIRSQQDDAREMRDRKVEERDRLLRRAQQLGYIN